ncbi:hypothetical protein, partial [Herbaspirillum chlorophenolicum]|uniref:hypothetical protein n=1 Tax=Herbaspirillum chlorophenolicum TaxID=211589 RepID=UPI001C3F4B2A
KTPGRNRQCRSIQIERHFFYALAGLTDHHPILKRSWMHKLIVCFCATKCRTKTEHFTVKCTQDGSVGAVFRGCCTASIHSLTS